MPFQTAVNRYPAAFVEGDFTSNNPRSTMSAGQGRLAGQVGLVAGPPGVIVGRFAWADQVTGVVTNAKPGAGNNRIGFVCKSNPALMTTWLAESTMTVQAGMNITVHTAVDTAARIIIAAATAGQKAFARDTDGAVQPGAAGAVIVGFTETPWFFEESGLVGETAKISTRS